VLSNSAAALAQTAPVPLTANDSYSFSRSAEQYLSSTFSPQNLISTAAGSAGAAAVHSMFHDLSPADYQRHFALNMTRNEIQHSIEFVTASLLRQDTRFRPSTEHGFANRVRYAVLQTFLDHGQHGSEIALPRLASAMGTAWVLDTWRPWMGRRQPNPWINTEFVFSSFVARSLWTEFKPDVKRQLPGFLKRRMR
jgi:hypothetical protein